MDTRTAVRDQYSSDASLRTRIDLYRRFRTGGTSWQEWLLDRLQLTPWSRIADVGAGSGELWEHAVRHSVAFASLLLIDQSAAMIAACRRSFRDDARMQFVVMEVKDRIPATNLDRILGAHMIYHVPEPRAFVRAAALSLGPGGSLYLTLPDGAHLKELAELLSSFFGTVSEPLGFPRGHAKDPLPHVREFFDEVEEESYSADLLINDAQALVAYVLSYPTLHGDRLPTPSDVDSFQEFTIRWLERTPRFTAKNRLIRGIRHEHGF